MNIKETLEKIELVNNYWLKTNPQKVDTGWSNACYFLGCLEAYKMTDKKEYLDAITEWGENHDWGIHGDAKYATDVLVNHFTVDGGCPWRFENDADYLNVHADHIFCGRTYLEMMKLVPDKAKFDKVMEILDFTVNDSHTDYWWWVDAIHMGLCLYHIIAKMKNDDKYARKGHALYMDIKEKRKCYDKEEHLWYRDERFFPEKELTKNGKKIFWSRGNGWVYAGLIQTLSVIDKDSVYYEEYKNTFLEMTDAIMKCRGKDGFWRCSLHDSEEYPMIETSGTLLFLNSIIKAVRCGILDKSYMKIFKESFDALNEKAVSDEGRICWVQGVAGSPGEVFEETTKEYAVGYYLMTCAEWIRYCREYGEE